MEDRADPTDRADLARLDRDGLEELPSSDEEPSGGSPSGAAADLEVALAALGGGDLTTLGTAGGLLSSSSSWSGSSSAMKSNLECSSNLSSKYRKRDVPGICCSSSSLSSVVCVGVCVSSLGVSSLGEGAVSEGREVRDAGEGSVREGRT